MTQETGKFVAMKMIDHLILFIKQYKTDQNKIKRLYNELNGKSCEIFELCGNLIHLNEVFYPITLVITVFVQILQLFLKN